jgi:hypothetical protein
MNHAAADLKTHNESAFQRRGMSRSQRGASSGALGLIVHAGPVAANDAAHPPLAHLIGWRKYATVSRCATGVTIFSKQILQPSIGQHGVGQEPLQPRVLAF